MVEKTTKKSEPKKNDKAKTTKKKNETVQSLTKGKLPQRPEKKKVLFATSECQPFVATGGLADVVGSLPIALQKARNDFEVKVVLPLYGAIPQHFKNEMKFLGTTVVSLAWRKQYCGVYTLTKDNVQFFFVDNEYYFKRDASYGFFDDGERFAFFSKAVLTILPLIDFFPDIIHCNDWQTALVPVYVKTVFKHDESINKIKTVFTIHNIAYQGKYTAAILGDVFDLGAEDFAIVDFEGAINLMKGAITVCDKLTTVSPTYAKEIQTSEFAQGLQTMTTMCADKLSGIINGIDFDYYNPMTDMSLARNFDKAHAELKKENKTALQANLTLPVDKDKPLIAMITRLVDHKGVDIVAEAFGEIMKLDAQFVLLGKGDKMYEELFCKLEKAYPKKMRAIIAFNQEVSRSLYGACDIFLMPSLSEPCGLSQMIASRYGAIPVVHQTGGLNDSIKNFCNDGGGNGFAFENYCTGDMVNALTKAVELCNNEKELWKQYQQKAFEADFSWENSAKQYIKLYEEILK